jgi:DNA-binding transcriptional regulator PaaX
MIVAKVTLLALAAAGAMTVAVMAPNIVQILGPHRRGRRRFYPTDVRRSLRQLERRGLIRATTRSGERTVMLTAAGRTQLAYWQLPARHRRTPRRWDGRWRLVCFDVPDTERTARRVLRQKLCEFGFLQVQKSVYIYPYECNDIVSILQDYFRLRPYLFYATTDHVLNDGRFRRHWSLPSRR